MHPWEFVEQWIGCPPVIDISTRSPFPMRIQSYNFTKVDVGEIVRVPFNAFALQLSGKLLNARDRALGMDTPVILVAGLATLVQEGSETSWQAIGPTQSFYIMFPDESIPLIQRLIQIQPNAKQINLFYSPLILQLAQSIIDSATQAGVNSARQREHLGAMAELMLWQACRYWEEGQPDNVQTSARSMGLLHDMFSWIQENLHEKISISELAERSHLSESHFRRKFQEAVGVPPHRYLLKLRLEHAQSLLSKTLISISDIAIRCGFDSQSHLTTSFNTAFGETPARYRRNRLSLE